jgi:nicotinamidase-related amidase
VINQPDEPVVLKHYINSFRETELKAVLDRHGIEAVVVVGNMSHMCVDGITRAAVDFGYATTVLHDACATLDLEFNGVKVPAEQVHAAFMAALSFGYAPVISTAEYLQGL